MAADILSTSHATICNKNYILYQVSEIESCAGIFMILNDSDEITVVSSQKLKTYLSKNEGWIHISICIDTPPESTGIMALISGVFAQHKVSIFPVASVSKAHIFVKNTELPQAKKCLEELGISYNQV